MSDSVTHPLHHLKAPIGVLAPARSPSKDYWLLSALQARRKEEYIYLGPKEKPDPACLDRLKSVVVVRLFPKKWVAILKEFRKREIPVYLLVDDAVFDLSYLEELGFWYRYRLWAGVTKHRKRLDRLVSELWVTSHWLKKHCQENLAGQCLEIKCLTLQPPSALVNPPLVYRIAYLGTASHHAEWRWLLPLLEKLQQRRNDCLLELVLPPNWRRRFRHLPRLRIFYPMDWETYLLDSGNRQVDLMLTPLLNSSFNKGRSPTKFFEAARLRAAGLYSNREPYKGFVRDGVDGLVLGDDIEEWLDGIDDLISNPVRRQRLSENCLQRALSQCLG